MKKDAYWILENLFREPEGYTCSRCRTVSREATAFCPNCGCRMRYVVDEEEEDFLDELEFLEDMGEEDF